MKEKKGFSLLEIILAIGVGAIIVAFGSNVFFNLSGNQAVEKEANVSLSYIEKARMSTINSLYSEEYGVNFSSTSVTVFPGEIYSAGNASNTVYNLGGGVSISSINLSNGGNSFYFTQISGRPSATGTLTFSQGGAVSKQITINGTGLAESN